MRSIFVVTSLVIIFLLKMYLLPNLGQAMETGQIGLILQTGRQQVCRQAVIPSGLIKRLLLQS